MGAYGVNAGLTATGLLMFVYALSGYAAETGLAWFRITKRKVNLTLLDDKQMRAFQRVTLRIFDLPHHPRRMRQAVRRWREWRENRDLINDATRGDGLSTLHGWVADSPQSGDGDGLRRRALGLGAGPPPAPLSPAQAALVGPAGYCPPRHSTRIVNPRFLS